MEWLSGRRQQQPRNPTTPAARPSLERLHRVALGDFHGVTPEMVQLRLLHTAPHDLELAMRVMLETNRFVDVVACSQPDTWAESVRHVKPASMAAACALFRDRVGLLQNVLPYVSKDFLGMMNEMLPCSVGPE